MQARCPASAPLTHQQAAVSRFLASLTAFILHVHAGVLVDFIPDEGRRKQLLTTVAAHFEQEGNVEVAMELERAAGQLEKALDLTNRQLSNALEQTDLRGDAASGLLWDAVIQGACGCASPDCLECAARKASLCCGCLPACAWPSGAEVIWSCLGMEC